MNPSSLSGLNLEVQEPACPKGMALPPAGRQKGMYKDIMLLRMRAHRTPLKNNLTCEVTGTRAFSYQQITIN